MRRRSSRSSSSGQGALEQGETTADGPDAARHAAMRASGDRVRRDRLRRLPVPAERSDGAGELEEALNRLTGERIRVRFAGRTDAGCMPPARSRPSALARRPGERQVGWPTLRRRLNALLPPDLVVRSLRSAAAGFDPRRDDRRVYRYRIRMAATGALPIGIGRSRSTTGWTWVRCAPPRLRSWGSGLRGTGSHAHGRTVRRVTEVRIVRNGTGRGPGHGERLPAPDGAQHRGAADRGGPGTARPEGGGHAAEVAIGHQMGARRRPRA